MSALGPVISGLLLDHFWWGSVFLINIPVMALLLVLGPVLVPESRNPDGGSFDWLGTALSLGTVLPVVYGIQQAAQDGVRPVPVAAIAAGAAIGVVFVWRQGRMLPDRAGAALLHAAREAFTSAMHAVAVTNVAVMAVAAVAAVVLLRKVRSGAPSADWDAGESP